MNTGSKRVGIYARVSTQDQSCEIQIDELRQYVNARGWSEPVLYEDRGLTGTNGNRPQLKRLLADCRARRIDILVVWKLDRFFRSLKDMVTTLAELNELGIEFISLRDQIDLSTGAGRLLVHLISAFAEFEASLIKERVRAGLTNAKKKGVKLGRPAKANPEDVNLLRNEGLSIGQIAKKLGLSKGCVHKTLQRKLET